MNKKIVVVFAVLLCVTVFGVGAQENAQPLIELGVPILLTYEFPLSSIEDQDYEDLTTQLLNRLRFGINLHLVFNVAEFLAIGVESGVSIGFTEPDYQDLIQDDVLPAVLGDGSVDTVDLITKFISLDVPFHLLLGFNLVDDITLDAFGGVVFRDVDSLQFNYFSGEIGARLNLKGLLIELGYIFPASSDATQLFENYTSNVFRIGVGVQAGR